MLWFDLRSLEELQVPPNPVLERSSSAWPVPRSVCQLLGHGFFFSRPPLNSVQQRYASHESRRPTEEPLALPASPGLFGTVPAASSEVFGLFVCFWRGQGAAPGTVAVGQRRPFPS